MNKELLALLKNKGSIYDYLGNEGHNLSKDEVIHLAKELLYAMYELRVRDKVFNRVVENEEEE